MNLQELGSELGARINETRLIPANRSILRACGKEILGMVQAYYVDGTTFFFTKGDLPNALASFTYAFGWLDAGSCLGYVSTRSQGLPQCRPDPGKNHSSDPRLMEKTRRYYNLLSVACHGLEPAPEGGSCLHDTGEKILMIARLFLENGFHNEQSGDIFSALASYSYGFGWLDAGVRIGLFRIIRNRELFTI